MVRKKVTLEVEVLKPDEVSDELVEAFVAALEGRERFLTLEELRELLEED